MTQKKFGALLIVLGLFCTFPTFSQQKIERIEPPFWWTGMQKTQLQVMVYGDNIGNLRPVINHPGITLESAVAVENPDYLFLYLNIANETAPGTFDIQFTDDGQTVLTQPYELKTREKNSANRESFNTSDVMYLITPDRFANGNVDNDAVKGLQEKPNRKFSGGRHGGDIQGISDHLDYIKDMGFTAIWVNPVLENDMPSYSYHGYATTDFYKVDPRYGSNESYKALCKKAQSMGIKVIMDMIANHCGSEHWFVLNPPSKDWINFGGEYVNTSHRRQTNQDIHASQYDKKKFADGWFVKSMPDLNQRNPLMADYLIENTLWWIEYTGLSGIRMDTYSYPDKHFMSDWTHAILTEYPNFNIVGEEWSIDPAIVSYWQKGKVNHDGYVSYLPSLMDFPLQNALSKGLNNAKEENYAGLSTWYETLAMDFLYPNPNHMVVFPDNHDMDRFYTQVHEDFDLFKMGITYILTTRGIPQIYYGTEILMDNEGHPGDHGVIRTDFPGGWPKDKTNAFTGSGLSDKQKEAQAFMQTLLQWRKNNKVIQQGKLMQFAPEDGIYGYVRYLDNKKVLVLYNEKKENQSVNFERFAEIIAPDAQAHEVLSNRNISFADGLSMPPFSSMVLEIAD